MQEGTGDALEALSLLPEAAGDDGQVMGILAVNTATVALEEETARLLLRPYDTTLSQSTSEALRHNTQSVNF